MNERPTYKDYKQSQKDGNVIMTPDGRLYFISNIWINKFFSVFVSLLILSTLFLITRSSFGLWPNLMAEWLIVFSVLSMLVEYPKYLLMRFANLDPGSQDYLDASCSFEPQQEKRQTKKSLRIVGNIMVAIWFIFLLLNSHTAELVRSLFDGQPRITSFEVTSYQENEGDDVLYSANSKTSQNIITLPTGGNPQVYAEIFVSRTLTPVDVTLDGQPLTYNFYSNGKRYSWFWEPEYLKQAFRFYLEDIRDGSTLTLTCGSLHREWVFDTSE